MGLLVGGTALEIAPAKAFALGGRTVKFLGKQALKTPYAQKTLQFASNRVTSKAVRTTKIANKFSIPDAGSQIANQVPFHFKGGSVNLDMASAVIRETYLGSGNMTSKYLLHTDDALKAGSKFLGPEYKILGDPARGVFRSADNLRQFRIDPSSLIGRHEPFASHLHFESFNKNFFQNYATTT